MDYHNNNARNFVNAINQYISKAFIPSIKNELPSKILIAAQLTMQEKIIQDKRPDALDIFQKEILSKEISENQEVEQIYKRFKELNILGFFDNIFLSETTFVGQRLQTLNQNDRVKEIVNFLQFLKNIDDEKKPLDYHGDVFYVSVLLVAKASTKYLKGVEPYINRAKKVTSNNINSLYVTGREYNMNFVDDVVNEIKNNNIGKLEWTRTYKTQDRKRNKRNAKIALFRL